MSTMSRLHSNILAAFLTLFLFTTNIYTCSATRLQQETSNTKFIKASCGITMYPDLCIKSLSAYATTIQTSPKQLVNAALSVSLTGVQSTSSTILKLSKEPGLKPREASAIKDCVENVGNSLDELQDSLSEMKNLRRGPALDMQMSNIQTWVSAALTNEDTCMDGFEGNGMNGNVKNQIRSSILSVAKLTSNALALVNILSNSPKAP